MREYRPKTKHEKAVDAHIPLAVRYADKQVAGVRAWSSDEQKARWGRIFSKKMNQLTIAAGLRVDFGKRG